MRFMRFSLKIYLLYEIKGSFKMTSCIWLHHFVYKLCLKIVFSSKKVFVEEVMLALVKIFFANYVQPTTSTCIFN